MKTTKRAIRVPLKHILVEGAAARTQLRERMDPETVAAYAELVRDGVKFREPVELVRQGKNFIIVDGWHRVHAHRVAGKREIEAVVLERVNGASALDSAILHALSANRAHGLRLTQGDMRRKARTALLHPDFRDATHRQIAADIGVSHQTVSRAAASLVREGVIPHPVTDAPICEANPDEYVGKRIIRDTFGDYETFKETLAFVRRLAAFDPRAWEYDAEERVVRHRGLERGQEVTFSVDGNQIDNGKPRERTREPAPTEPTRTTPTGAQRAAWERAARIRSREAAARRLLASGDRALIAAVKTLEKYQHSPDVADDIRALLGGFDDPTASPETENTDF